MRKAILAILLTGLIMAVYAQNGVVKELTGTVELKAAGAAAFTPATAGTQISADTVISTGFKSTALVEVGSAVIAVRPLTRLTLTEISASQGVETINMNLQAGRVRVDVNPPAGTKASLSVASPTATASVRGTSFYIDTMSVSVLEGTVAFKGNTGYTIQVGAGSFSVIDTYSGVAAGAQSSGGTGLVPSSPAGYDATTTGNTGGTGVVPGSPSEPSPPVNPPVNPPPSGGNNGGNGWSGGGSGGTNTGTVNIPITYN
jgi:hypothetical protein